MKKKIIFVLLVLIVISIFIIYNSKKDNVLLTENAVLAIIDGNGNRLASIPNKGNYQVKVNCTNANGSWDYINWKIVLANIKADVSCTLEFIEIDKMYLADFIKGEYSTKPIVGNGEFVDETHNTKVIPDMNTSQLVKTFTSMDNYSCSYSGFDEDMCDIKTGLWDYNSSTGIFTSNESSMTSSYYYYGEHIKLPEAGYYQVCFSMDQAVAAGATINVYFKSSLIYSAGASTSAAISNECMSPVYMDTNYYLDVDVNGSNIPNTTFKIYKYGSTSVNLDAGYRYEGRNPNNYVMFNNELWRIIGVFDTEYDSNNDGTVDSNDGLVKIIRNESIGSFVLGYSPVKSNYWPNSTIYYLLNGGYYDWENNKNSVNDYCYTYRDPWSTNKKKCNFLLSGIKDDYRDMIVNAKWYLGKPGKNGYYSFVPNIIFQAERDTSTVTEGLSSIVAHVGLIYLSDYAYAASNNTCPHGSYKLDSYNTSDGYGSPNCYNNNWLFSNQNYWTIDNNTSYFYYIQSGGYASTWAETAQTMPTVFLSPDVYLISGDGTPSNPYIIGM